MQKYGMQNYTSHQIGGQTQISSKIGPMEFAIKFHIPKCAKFYIASFGSVTQSSTL
jgi:hypothetical protein